MDFLLQCSNNSANEKNHEDIKSQFNLYELGDHIIS